MKNELVLAVGWTAFVNWPVKPGTRAEALPTTDSSGQETNNDLRDGQEVEITAWRPHAREGLSYRISRVSDGAECWIRALYLRRARVAAPAAAAK